MEAIVAEQLKKTYRNGVQAVKGVSFYVKQGEIFGLLGPNGAGKSTTVRILATLTKPDSGKALVAGHDVVLEPQRVRSKIGYVAQSSGVDKYATGRENLMLQGHLQRVPKSQLKHRVNELLEWVGLSEAADRLVQTYSGGMKRRLDIAMGLVHNPSVLFLDEPTTGLDPETRSALWQDLLRLKREQNISVLLTTHYLDEADYLCDRLAIVDHGVVVAEGSPSDLKAGIRGDRVTVEIEGHVDEANERLKLLPQVIDIIVTDHALVARVENGATAIPAIVTALEGSGISVRSVALSRPSLDDVYLYHTGHRFVAEGTLEGADTIKSL